jgi:hypothetical protein
MMEEIRKITCGPDNIDSFKTEMRQHCPEFYDLAVTLYKRGMLTGLRGATLEIGISQDILQNHEPEPAPERTCEECAHWVRDSVGDGTGVGKCLLNEQPNKLKWPKQTACEKFSEIRQ